MAKESKMSEQELREFYAGLAMLGLIIKGEAVHRIPVLADRLATEMVQLKKDRDE